MILEDAKARRKEATAKAMEQTQVDEHFHRAAPEDKPAPYSDKAFREAALQWLIQTDQVSYIFPKLPYLFLISITAPDRI